MKKSSPKKLILCRETVRCLEADRFALVQGGQPVTSPSVCFSGGEDCCISR